MSDNSAAVAGSCTICRILRFRKSAAVSFAALSSSRSRNAPRNCSPPLAQAASYAASRSSGVTSHTERSWM